MWMLLKKNVIRNLYLALFPLLFHLQAISFVLSALFQLAYLCIYISYQQALFSFFHHPVPSTYFRIHKDVFYCIIMILVVSSCARFEKWLIPPNQHSWYIFYSVSPQIGISSFFHVITLLKPVHALSESHTCTIITRKSWQLDESVSIRSKHLSAGTLDMIRPWLITNMLIQCNICSADQCISHNLCDTEGVYIWWEAATWTKSYTNWSISL